MMDLNFKDVVNGEIFAPLRDLDLLNCVIIDPEEYTIVWPNGAHFDPEILHEWKKYEDELINRSRKWDIISSVAGLLLMTEACIVEKPEKKEMPMMPLCGCMGDISGMY